MSEISLPNLPALLAGRRRILVTGGAGFIGGAVVRRLLSESEALVFNLDKCGYASDLTSIEALPQAEARHQLLRVDLTDAAATSAAMQQADPDLVLHLAAEGHVGRSIEGPGGLYREQCERHLPPAAGGARPLGAAAGGAAPAFPLPSHQHR